jgi:hypothetical protein
MKPSIELHIEKLVLHDFTRGGRYRIGEAVERELAKLFTEQGVSPSLTQRREIAYLNGGVFEATPDIKAEALGIRVAQAIYGGLNP